VVKKTTKTEMIIEETGDKDDKNTEKLDQMVENN